MRMYVLLAQAVIALCGSERNSFKIGNLVLFVFTYVRSHNSIMSAMSSFIISINVMNEIRCYEFNINYT